MAYDVEVLKNKMAKLGQFNRTFVAYSGGLDSTVLLHSLATAMPEASIIAIHINHGISRFADDWQGHCEQVCLQLGVELIVERVVVEKQSRKSLEAVARDKRYEVFRSLLSSGDGLMLAQHQDDQAETLLLQLLRGAGVKGLAAMPSKRRLGLGSVCRPLLNITRQDLNAYAITHSLDWIEDDSNQDDAINRNYLRNQVMPLIKERWPQSANVISRSAAHCAEAADLINQLAEQDLNVMTTDDESVVDVKQLVELSLARQKNLLRVWLMQQAGLSLSQSQLSQLMKQQLSGQYDSQPEMQLGEFVIKRSGNQLVCLPLLEPIPKDWSVVWDGQSDIVLPSELGLMLADDLKAIISDISGEVEVRFRQGGETLYLNNQSSCSLKTFLYEQKVPVWQRDRVPLIYHNGKLTHVLLSIVS